MPARLALVLLFLTLPVVTTGGHRWDGPGSHGDALRRPVRVVVNPPGTVEAAFDRASYAPGEQARVRLIEPPPHLTVQVFRVGGEARRPRRDDVMHGVPATQPASVEKLLRGDVLTLRVGDWPTGLYFARFATPRGAHGFAPFVVRPRTLGEHDVAVVLPTFTWYAYNLRDGDADGNGDSWYADPRRRDVALARPFLDRGVPYNFRRYDLPFLRWLSRTGRTADVLTDSDLDTAVGHRLARAYSLIVLPGHHEYVTAREFDALQTFRDLGGNLAFLSANNLYWEVKRRGDILTRVARWRDRGRPEAQLVGVQYRANDDGRRRTPWRVTDAAAAPWLFARTGLSDGSPFGRGGVEVDSVTADSAPDVRVLAEIPDAIGGRFTAHMTFYRTDADAKVFAAGAFYLFRTVETDPVLDRLLCNLWDELSRP